mgnify:CR=1 FL=1
MIWSEVNIIFAIVGMIGLFSTAIIWQRANRITARYYGHGRNHKEDRTTHTGLREGVID